MLIIEGCDQAGKTTLARECVKVLSEDYGMPMMYGHLDKPPKSWDKYWSYRELVNRHVVMDRFHMSHVAYRAIDKEPHDLTPLTYAMVDAEVALQGGLVVLVTMSNVLITNRWAEKHPDRDEMYACDHVRKVNDVFIELAKRPLTLGYKPKVDFYIELCSEAPYVNRQQIDAICSMYSQQQREHDRIHERRPAGHVR